MAQRRPGMGDRSVQKQVGRASYEIAGYSSTHSDTDFDDIHRNPTSNLLHPDKFTGRMKYSQIPRTPSQSNIRTNKDQYFRGNAGRRKNDGNVNKLKSELQSLKMQVSKLMNKGTDSRIQRSRNSILRSQGDQSDDQSDRVSLQKYGKQISDSVSVTSENLIDGPIKRLESQFDPNSGYDHAHYLELENNVLKTQLKNLKNKYNATKQDLKQKNDILERKNQYLQVSLRRSQQDLNQYKRHLEGELQTIKFQLARKHQQQVQEEQRRVAQLQKQPEHDNSITDNQYIRNKMNKLYQQLSEKDRIINSVNAELNDAKGEIQKKNFEFKKQIEKNSELGKQLQFARRQNSRSLTQIDQQLQKKKQLQRNIDGLKQRIQELSKELKLKDQIVSGSQQFESKLSVELQHYKELQQRLSQQNCQLNNQIRKLDQLNQSHDQEITYLKNNISEFTQQIEQLSRNLRLEKERALGIQTNYRKMLDQTKENDQRQIEMLKNQLENYRDNNNMNSMSGMSMSIRHDQNLESQNVNQTNQQLLEKDRQISKWKAQYKLLKMKYQENQALESSKKQEIQSYYKSYTEYKSKIKILEMRNKVLEASANQYIEKIQVMQSSNLQQRQSLQATIRELQIHLQQTQRANQQMHDQINDLLTKLQMKGSQIVEQEQYRKQLENKVLNLDLQEHDGLNEILESVKRRAQEQDQRVNKYIKQVKSKEATIAKLKEEIKQMLQSQENQLHTYRERQIFDAVQEVKTSAGESLKELRELARKDLDIERQAKQQLLQENAALKGQLSELQRQLKSIRQEIKDTTHLYNLKSAELNGSIDKHMRESDAAEAKFEQQAKIFGYKLKNLQTQLTNKKEQVLSLRTENRKLITMKIDSQGAVFDQALKNQLEINKKVKQQLDKKNEEVYRLRDSLASLNAQYDNIKAETDIAKLKSISDKKNIQVAYDIQMQQLKNNLAAEQKKIIAFQQKIKMIIDENKKKDTFIQSIMSKKLNMNDRENVMATLRQYQITVTGKNISEKIQAESQQLERLSKYNFNLMKQIAELNQRLLLYEAVSKQNLSQNKDILRRKQ